MQSGLATSPSADSPPPVSAFDSSSAYYGLDDVSAGDEEEAARLATTGSLVWREELEESEAASRLSEESSHSEPAADVQSDLAAESYSLVSAEMLSRVRDQTVWKQQKKSSQSLKYRALRGKKLE